jgi:hypothetical protein
MTTRASYAAQREQMHTHIAAQAPSSIRIPDPVRELLGAPNYVHLSTLRADGSPRNWVVWVSLEGEQILICTSDQAWKGEGHVPVPPRRDIGRRSCQPVPDGGHPRPSHRDPPR